MFCLNDILLTVACSESAKNEKQEKKLMLVCVFVVLTRTKEGIARLKMHSL